MRPRPDGPALAGVVVALVGIAFVAVGIWNSDSRKYFWAAVSMHRA